jgi:chorismate mutase
MEPGLDLKTSIRPGLDILGNEIIIALKKRSRLLINAEIYSPGLVLVHPTISLLDYELGQVERVHAELGRFTYASQEAFTDVSGVTPVIDRAPPPSPIEPMDSGVGPRVLTYYREWIERGCSAGSDADTFGETVTADVAALMAIMQRVNLGKYVAEIKFTESPDKFHATGGDREGIVELIVRRDREAEVEALAVRLGEHYDFSPDEAGRLFRTMIDITVDIEVDYIRMRMAEER